MKTRAARRQMEAAISKSKKTTNELAENFKGLQTATIEKANKQQYLKQAPKIKQWRPPKI